MAKAATDKSAVYAPPDLMPATTLRPEVVARLELLRIVSAWRPQWDAKQLTEAAAQMEQFVSGS